MSSSASATENSPTVNSRSRSSSLALRASSSHMRPRSSASATSWSGASGIDESATTVAQRRTARVPSSVSASRVVSILRGSAKKAELTWRSSASESPTSAPMIRSSSSKEASEPASSDSACSERDRAAAALAARPREELALEVREAQHAAARELVRGRDAGGHELEPALGRPGDQRRQRLVVAAADARP